jgi:hypothetical protein
LSSLVCLGRHTVTGLVSTSGRQFLDWTADYRLFSRQRCKSQALFDVVRRAILKGRPPSEPLVTAMDDSLLRKRGVKAAGVKYLRDPLSPPFHPNLVCGQRVLQLSAARVSSRSPAQARMIPIDFKHVPAPQKPSRRASEDQWRAYASACNELNLSRKGVARLAALRTVLDQDPAGPNRPLWSVVDGRFTNGTVLKNLPERTVLIGRVRKDTKLYYSPSPSGRGGKTGRRAVYGKRAPTPEQLQMEPRVPWTSVRVYAAGKVHAFKVKTLSPLRWRTAGARHALRLIVVAPLAYRPRKGARLLYRRPAYLLCTDPDLPLKKVLQAYVWRWDIEVNFRDEKTLLGMGQAQVRKAASVESVPQLLVAAYALLLVAATETFKEEGPLHTLPSPKWRRRETGERASTQKLINHLRAELWGKAMGIDPFCGFRSKAQTNQKPHLLKPHLASAVLYATG